MDWDATQLTVPLLGLQMRPVSVTDAATVIRWRNAQESQDGFFSTGMINTSKHRAFVRSRPSGDYTWMFSRGRDTIGMAGLIVDPDSQLAESGRLCIDCELRSWENCVGIPLANLWFAFEVLGLFEVWCDVFTANSGAMKINKRVGFQNMGFDLEGHTHAKGPVAHHRINCMEWQGLERRCKHLGLIE